MLSHLSVFHNIVSVAECLWKSKLGAIYINVLFAVCVCRKDLAMPQIFKCDLLMKSLQKHVSKA